MAVPVDIAIALVWRQGSLLITRRPEGKHLAGLWEFPGGKCLPAESAEECAVREVREEVGVACEAVTVRPVIEYAYPDRTVRLHPVDCRCLGGAPRALDVAEWAWVAPGDLGRYSFPPANEELLRALISGEATE
jgi:mutator protein MutT